MNVLSFKYGFIGDCEIKDRLKDGVVESENFRTGKGLTNERLLEWKS